MSERPAIVITTRHEFGTIFRLVRDLIEAGYPVIVVDDASTDSTRYFARVAGATVFNTSTRQGIGPCLRLGWQRALDMGCTRVIVIDAGGSHEPADLPALLAALDGGADLVIGSRFRAGSHYAGRPWRRLASRLCAGVCNLLQAGPWFTDWTSGYRGYSERALRTLLDVPYWYGRMHGFQIEVLGHARCRGLTVVEVPIRYVAGRSSFNGAVALEAAQVMGHLFHHLQHGFEGKRRRRDQETTA